MIIIYEIRELILKVDFYFIKVNASVVLIGKKIYVFGFSMPVK